MALRAFARCSSSTARKAASGSRSSGAASEIQRFETPELHVEVAHLPQCSGDPIQRVPNPRARTGSVRSKIFIAALIRRAATRMSCNSSGSSPILVPGS